MHVGYQVQSLQLGAVHSTYDLQVIPKKTLASLHSKINSCFFGPAHVPQQKRLPLAFGAKLHPALENREAMDLVDKTPG